MSRPSFRGLGTTIALGLTVLAAGAGAAFACTGIGELIDNGTRVIALETQIARTLASGQYAQPGALAQSAVCGFGAPSQIFRQWGDGASYSLAPQGDLASTSAWVLRGTTVAANHDPYTRGSSSLMIGSGGKATSPPMCISLSHPTFRLFARTTGLSSALTVSVLYENMQGSVVRMTLANLRAGSAWQPTIIIPFTVNAASTASAGGWTAVALEFRPTGLLAGQYWWIDGLYVDPYRRI
jgi:hypothetical protein